MTQEAPTVLETPTSPAQPPNLERSVLEETREILAILTRYARTRAKQQGKTQSRQRAQHNRQDWWTLGKIVLTGFVLSVALAFVPPALAAWGQLLIPLGVLVFSYRVLLNDARRFNVELLEDSQTRLELEWPYVQELPSFSPAALTYAAGQLKASERSISERMSLLVGSNRSNGLLGLGAVTFGYITFAKYLQDQDFHVPFVNLPISTNVVVYLLLTGYALFALVLYLGSKTHAVTSGAELLERALTLKNQQAK